MEISKLDDLEVTILIWRRAYTEKLGERKYLKLTGSIVEF